MLNELDKTLARMGAYITALEQALARAQEQLKDKEDAQQKIDSGAQSEHGPVSGPASD